MAPPRNIVWLASYPKSGNTWTRVFLANYLAPNGAKVSINGLDRFTTTDIRQDWYDRAAGRPFRGESFDDSILLRRKVHHLIAAAGQGTQLVKTHSKLDRIGPVDLITPEVTAAAIYILRNPFDLVPSYARHMGTDIDTAIGLVTEPKNLNHSDSGIYEVLGRWDDHIASWLGAQGLPRHVMRYEDMIADAERAFRGLLGFLRLLPNDGQLRRAIRAASFGELQKAERREGFRERPAASKQFFHSGRAGAWREALSPAQVARIRAAFLPALEAHYPEMLAETAEFAEAT